jgi:hypothetical protein
MKWRKAFKKVRPRIDPIVIQTLTGANIADMEALQDRFYGDLESSLRKAAETLNVRENVIAELVAKSLVSSSEPLTTSRIGKRWADVVLVLALVYVVLALARPWLGLVIPTKVAELPKIEPQVVAATTIPIYGMIRDDNLRVKNGAPGVQWEQMTSKLVGRYAVAAIAAGAAITENKLSSKRSDLAGQSVLRIEIKHAVPLDERGLPEDVDLLFSPRQGATAGASLPARLLALDAKATPPLATVAMAKDKADEAAKWMGSSDVYLSLRVR